MHCHVSVKRNQGRQPKKWIDNIKDEMEAKNIHTKSNDYCVGQRQIEASSSSLIVIVK